MHLRESLRDYMSDAMLEANKTGVPAIRPLFLEFPSDKKLWELGELVGGAYMFGAKYLVCPVTTFNVSTWDVYLPALPPAEHWTHYYTNATFTGGQLVTIDVRNLDTFPLFVRGPIDDCTEEPIPGLVNGWNTSVGTADERSAAAHYFSVEIVDDDALWEHNSFTPFAGKTLRMVGIDILERNAFNTIIEIAVNTGKVLWTVEPGAQGVFTLCALTVCNALCTLTLCNMYYAYSLHCVLCALTRCVVYGTAISHSLFCKVCGAR